jgi:hypothetical protein
MDDTARDLVTRMLSVFPGYVEGRLKELDLERPASFDGALAAGAAWLRANLEALLALPFHQQRRGPLEVFQEAMRFPTDALAGAGVPVVPRDPGSAAALPGDVYSLAPASSRQLGEEVWTAHLTWGATKARAMRRTRLVGLLSGNLMDRSRIGPLVERSGAQLVVWTNYAAGTENVEGDLPELVLADLAVPDSLRAIEGWVQAGVRVIAYGPHVDRQALRSARLAGAEQVLARSVFFEKLGGLFS